MRRLGIIGGHLHPRRDLRAAVDDRRHRVGRRQRPVQDLRRRGLSLDRVALVAPGADARHARREALARTPRAGGSRRRARCACRLSRRPPPPGRGAARRGARADRVGDVDASPGMWPARELVLVADVEHQMAGPSPSSRSASSSASISSIRSTGRSSERQAVIPPSRKPRTRRPTDAEQLGRLELVAVGGGDHDQLDVGGDDLRHLGGEAGVVGRGAESRRGCGPRRTARWCGRRPRRAPSAIATSTARGRQRRRRAQLLDQRARG